MATGVNFSGTEGLPLSTPVATITDTDPTITAADLSATIDWGDGTATTTGQITVGTAPMTFTVDGSHVFPEEAGSVVPPGAFNVVVTIQDTKNALQATANDQASITDAPLSPGNPVAAGTPMLFSGVGTAAVTSALGDFRAAIGGVNNGDKTTQAGGFRAINWDGVKLDGTDFGGGANTTVISNGSTVAIPQDRFQTRGVFFGAIYAVSNDGFTTVNPTTAGLFPAFSPKNTFAMFNDNGIDFKFVAPSASNTSLVSAASRGFGAVFLNVEEANTTSIQYFHGSTLLDTVFVPVGTQGQPEFAGELFNNPIVTNVVLTLGTDVLFKFDGTTFGAGGVVDNPIQGHNLVVADDFDYAEPVPIANGFPITSGSGGTSNGAPILTTTAGTAFSGVVASFSDADPMGNAKDYTATINWGDGHLTNGSIVANGSGGFDVSGTNTYARAGQFPINVDIADFGGGPGASGSAPTLAVNNTAQVNQAGTTTTVMTSASPALFGQPLTFGAVVSGLSGGRPTGTVTFYDNGTVLGTSTLVTSGPDEVHFFQFASFTTTTPLAPGGHFIGAIYNGDDAFTSSIGFNVQVVNNAVPTILSLGAPVLPVGNSSLPLVLTGTDFNPGSVAYVNAMPVATTFVNATTLVVTVPAGDFAQPALLIFGVINPGPGGGLSNALGMSVVPANTATTLEASQVSNGFVTFTARVSAISSDATPGGKVTFHVGRSTHLVPLVGGAAHFRVRSSTLRNVTVFAQFNPDARFNPSTSAPIVYSSSSKEHERSQVRSAAVHPVGPMKG
jgi:hypothetical protein